MAQNEENSGTVTIQKMDTHGSAQIGDHNIQIVNPTIIHQKSDLDTNQKLIQNRRAFKEYEEYISKFHTSIGSDDSDIWLQDLFLMQVSLDFISSHEHGVLSFAKSSHESKSGVLNGVVAELRNQNENLFPVVLTDSIHEILKGLADKTGLTGLVNDTNISDIGFLGLGTFAIESSHKKKKLVFFIADEIDTGDLNKLAISLEKLKSDFPGLYFFAHTCDKIQTLTESLRREIALDNGFSGDENDTLGISSFLLQNAKSLKFLEKNTASQNGNYFVSNYFFKKALSEQEINSRNSIEKDYLQILNELKLSYTEDSLLSMDKVERGVGVVREKFARNKLSILKASEAVLYDILRPLEEALYSEMRERIFYNDYKKALDDLRLRYFDYEAFKRDFEEDIFGIRNSFLKKLPSLNISDASFQKISLPLEKELESDIDDSIFEIEKRVRIIEDDYLKILNEFRWHYMIAPSLSLDNFDSEVCIIREKFIRENLSNAEATGRIFKRTFDYLENELRSEIVEQIQQREAENQKISDTIQEQKRKEIEAVQAQKRKNLETKVEELKKEYNENYQAIKRDCAWRTITDKYKIWGDPKFTLLRKDDDFIQKASTIDTDGILLQNPVDTIKAHIQSYKNLFENTIEERIKQKKEFREKRIKELAVQMGELTYGQIKFLILFFFFLLVVTIPAGGPIFIILMLISMGILMLLKKK